MSLRRERGRLAWEPEPLADCTEWWTALEQDSAGQVTGERLTGSGEALGGEGVPFAAGGGEDPPLAPGGGDGAPFAHGGGEAAAARCLEHLKEPWTIGGLLDACGEGGGGGGGGGESTG